MRAASVPRSCGAADLISFGDPMVAKLFIWTIAVYAAMAALLCGVAGTWRWPQAWILAVEMAASGLAIGLWLARHDSGLLAERLAPPFQRGQERLDKVFMASVVVLWIAWHVFMALDAARFRLSHVPPWAQAIGALVIMLSMGAVFLTFRENSFAAPVVKIQKERGQTVVTTGPYRYVRHPMYAGASLMFVGIPLLLGSAYGLAFAPLWVVLLSLRIPMEERLLRANLAGYDDYATRVRYRLVPGIW
jgi:protein-S-isoprenylcysteine O-methyltransferase Ste14